MAPRKAAAAAIRRRQKASKKRASGAKKEISTTSISGEGKEENCSSHKDCQCFLRRGLFLPPDIDEDGEVQRNKE